METQETNAQKKQFKTTTINNMESEMRILARKTKDILSRYRALQVKFRDLEREKDVERKARKKAETELIEMKKMYEKELEEARAIRKRAVLKEMRRNKENSSPCSSSEVTKLKRKLREETEKRVEATKQLDRVNKKRDEMLMSRMKKLEQQIDTITESTRGNPAARLRALQTEMKVREQAYSKEQAQIATRLQTLLAKYKEARVSRNKAVLAAKEDREQVETIRQQVTSLQCDLKAERSEKAKLRSQVNTLKEENEKLEIQASAVTRPDLYPEDANKALVIKQKEIEAGRAQIAQLLLIVNRV